MEPAIATVLQRWMRSERLRPYQIAEAAGLSRAHVGLILHGRVTRPSDDTLRKLAVGVATHPYDGTVDRETQAAALRAFSLAVGIEDLNMVPEPGSLYAACRAAGISDQPSRFWETFVLSCPEPDPALQQILLGVAERLGRRGATGDDVTAWLMEHFGPAVTV